MTLTRRSRNLLLGLLTVGAVLAVLVPLGLLETRRPPDWQTTLDEYLKDSGRPASPVLQVRSAEAHTLDGLRADSLISVSNGWLWEGIFRIPPAGLARCVDVERQAGPLYLVLSYHDDSLYRAGWLVHEFKPGTSESEQQAVFAGLGCTRWGSLAPAE